MEVVTSAAATPPDLLIALHGVKSHAAIADYRRRRPDGRLVLVLTGTDLYPRPSTTCRQSMALADRVVVLHPGAVEDLPAEARDRARVIVQGAPRRVGQGQAGQTVDGPALADGFQVAVVGHLRAVKDPLLTAAAARRVPAGSALAVVHAGGILEPEYEDRVRREQEENPRYRWLGELAADKTARLLADSRLLVLTSHMEGGARVIGEAVVHGTPVLSTRIAAAEGLLGSDYPGLFPVGDDAALAALLLRCEGEPGFLDGLRRWCRGRADLFDPERERRALLALVGELLPDAVNLVMS